MIATEAVTSAPATDPADHALLRAPRRRAKALLSLLETAQANGGGVLSEQLAAWRDIANSLPGEALVAVAAEPLFAHWWAQLVARRNDPRATAAWLRELPRFLAVPALREGVWRDGVALELPLTAAGEARFPGHPRHLRLDGAECVVALDGTELLATTSGVGRRIPAARLLEGPPTDDVVERATFGRSEIELDGTDAWTADVLHEMNAQKPVGPYPQRDLEPLAEVSPALLATYEESLRLIGDAWPDLLAEFETHVRLVVPFASQVLAGWTHAFFQGAIFVQAAEGDVMFTAESAVHEEAHTRLNLLTVQPLHLNEPSDLFPSPIRLDRRPASGVFHAVFVFGRLVEFWARAAAVAGDAAFEARALELLPKYRQGFRTLTEEVALTPFGHDLLIDLDRRVVTLDLPEQEAK